MSGRYDIEDFLSNFIDKFKSVLKSKIDKVNTDKGDTLLQTVDSQAFFYKKSSPQAKACDVFVYYEPYEEVSFDESQSLGGYSFPAKTYQFEFGVAFRENSRDADESVSNFKRVVRYQKAFEEALVETNLKVAGRGYSNIEIINIKSSNEERDGSLLHISGFNVDITLGG